MSAPAYLQAPVSARARVPVRHTILPDHLVAQATARPRETVQRFLARVGWRFDLPTICLIDGAPLLRRARGWRRRRLRAGEQVEFVSRPMGGGGGSGKSVLGLVAMIALSVLAPGIGSVLAGGAGLAANLIGGALIAGGGFVLNTVLGAKGANKSEDQTKHLYDFGPQTNSARLREALPVQYGRLRKTPDFASLPWTDYVGDDQYIHVLLVDGEGRYQREQIEVGSTVLWTAATGLGDAFKDVQIEFYEPNQPVTLFPTNIASSAEVSGQELAEPQDWVGTYVSNASGTKANKIACDFVLPAGLYSTNNKGQKGSYLCEIYVQARPINDVGATIGEWSTIIHHVRSGASAQPMRFTLTADVGPGRYQVRARRGVPTDYPVSHTDTCVWSGMRAYLTDAPPSYPVSVTAIRMRATDQLTGSTATQFRTTTTRILPVWTGTAWVEQPTRRPAWALLDIARNSAYGCDLALADIDVQAIVDLAAINTTRDECFDYEFRSVTQATEALDTPLRVCRARHRWLGSTLSLVREAWRPVPAQLLTDREIVRGSLSLTYQMQPDDAADALIAEYLDETSWQSAEVQVPPDITPLRPRYIEWPGAVKRAQVASLTNFLWLQNTRRRVLPTLTTERDGRMLGYGDVISLQSDLPQDWGAAAAIVARAGLTLTFDRAMPWGDGQSYVRIRTATGRQFGPVKIARGASDAIGLLDAEDLALVESQQSLTLAAALTRRASAEPPSCVIGLGVATEVRALVLRGRPSGDKVQLDLVVDDPQVHAEGADPGSAPPLAALADPPVPRVAGLTATLEQNVMEPLLSASWLPAAGALSYDAQISYDGRVTWAGLASVTAPSLSLVVRPAALSLRVQAVGRARGAWAVIDLDAPVIEAPKVDVGDVTGGLKDLITQQMSAATQGLQGALDELALRQAEATAATCLAQIEDRVVIESAGDALASHASQIGLLATDQAALASRSDVLSADLGTVSAKVKTSWTASATPTGAISAMQMSVVADGRQAGLHLVSTSAGAYIALEADKTVFRSSAGEQTALLDGSSGSLYLNGSLYADGSIIASKLAAGSVTTDKITIGGVTTDRVGWAAINNIKTASSDVTVTQVDGLLSLSITRTAGTVCSIRVQMYLGKISGAFYAAGGAPSSSPSRLFAIRRWIGGAGSSIAVIPFNIPPVVLVPYQNVIQYEYGNYHLTIEHVDSDNVSGLVSYDVLLLDGSGAAVPWGGGVGRRVMILQEIKR